MAKALPLALTCGDPSGVGPEIIARWLEEHPDWKERVCPIGPAAWLDGLPAKGVICSSTTERFSPGKPTRDGSQVAWEALEIAAQGCREGRFSGVVTGPVSKENLSSVGFPYPGQTEFFAHAWGGVPSMAFAGKELRVILATWHLPLAEAIKRLADEPDLLDRAVIHAVKWGRLEGLLEPRIAVCGLNPHAGENGLLGSEERDILNPRLDVLRRLYPGLSRCLPGDTVFHRMRQGEFDIAVALYHDQGLIPVKTLEFHSAVNLSFGLKYIRTSPDHGTAFDIAGRGLARTGSFANAVALAQRYTSVLPG